MTIRTKLRITQLISFFAALCLIVLLVLQNIERTQRPVERLSTAFIALQNDMLKYLSGSSKIGKETCMARFDDFKRVLDNVSPELPDKSRQQMRNVREDLRRAEEYFIQASTRVNKQEVREGTETWGALLETTDTQSLEQLHNRISNVRVSLATNIESFHRTDTPNYTPALPLIFAVAVLLATGAASILARRTIIKPIGKLSEGVKHIASGNLDYRMEVNTSDEIGELAHAFNNMTEKLKTSYNNLQEEVAHRRQAEFSLRESEKRYRRLVDTMNEGIFMLDANGRFVYVNRRLCEMLGYTQETLLRKEAVRFLKDETNKEIFNGLLENEKSGESGNNELIWKDAEDRFLHSLVSHLPFLDEDGCFEGSFGVITNISERKKAESALWSQKERLAVTLKSIGDGVITTDVDGKIDLMNKEAEKVVGTPREHAEKQPVERIFRLKSENGESSTDTHFFRNIVTRGLTEESSERTLLDADNNQVKISLSGSPIRNNEGNIIGTVFVFRDVTTQRQMEEELLKAQKLESIGYLAGGIAHDFNNILTVVLGNLSLARSMAPDENDLQELLGETEKASHQAKYLTQQLLTFSKGGAPVKEQAAIDELIPEAVSFVLRGSNVKSSYDLPDNLWPVEVDVGQISQVFQNLVLNAKDALLEGGHIWISARNREITEQNTIPIATGKYVQLLVQDEGKGMPQEYQEKVFDPYFTTKPDGNGLGLASVYSIIKKHGGYITVDSGLNEGTRFDIFLPVNYVYKEPKSRTQDDEIVSGSGQILVMDDEASILELLRRMLPSLGYEVVCTEDGAEATAEYEKAFYRGEPYDALLLDLTVPGGMGGKETVTKLKETDPDLKAIVSSGYSNDPIMAEYRKYGFSGVVCKPYQMHELSKALHQVIYQNREYVAQSSSAVQ